jgi:hypothetical protein
MFAAAVVSGCSGGSGAGQASQQAHTIRGTISISPPSDTSSAIQIPAFDTSAVDCQDPKYDTVVSGYGDLTPGTQVSVKDASGKLIATGQLGDGKIASQGSTCIMSFTVGDVPDNSFYQVEVAHRGNVNYSLKEMQDNGWQISLTIG